jgi:hypothetical protein
MNDSRSSAPALACISQCFVVSHVGAAYRIAKVDPSTEKKSVLRCCCLAGLCPAGEESVVLASRQRLFTALLLLQILH